jgi:hypothetical protein
MAMTTSAEASMQAAWMKAAKQERYRYDVGLIDEHEYNAALDRRFYAVLASDLSYAAERIYWCAMGRFAAFVRMPERDRWHLVNRLALSDGAAVWERCRDRDAVGGSFASLIA